MARTCSAVWTATLCAIALGVVSQLSVRAKEAQANSNASVTMTGCLRTNSDGFVLTNLTGKQTPKGRTWKTAYILKTKKNLHVMASSGVNLQNQIGRQVTVVGVVDGEKMTARSIKRVSASC